VAALDTGAANFRKVWCLANQWPFVGPR